MKKTKVMRDTKDKDTYSLFSSDLFLADIARFTNLSDTDVLIRSGQYFATLATKIDKLSDELKKGNEVQEQHLQDIVNELLFIQQHYQLQRKTGKTNRRIGSLTE